MIAVIFACRYIHDRGRRAGRRETVAWLRDQADLHRGQGHDRLRRAALNHAADRLALGHRTGRPPLPAGARRG